MQQVKFPNGTRVTWTDKNGSKQAGQIVAHDLDDGDALVWQDALTSLSHSGEGSKLDAEIPEEAEGKCWWIDGAAYQAETPSILSELTPADRRAGWLKLMNSELLNAPVLLLENAEDAADLAAIREALDRIGGRG